MTLSVLYYGHPILRKKGAPIDAITPEIQKLIEDMRETMYAANGIGLAAQQVGHALQLALIDVREVTDRPSTLTINGKPADVAKFMPLTLINPVITPLNEPEAGPEGCLSFPEVYADITRPESVEVKTQNEKGDQLVFQCGGLLARAIQHEADHLSGILFIDRMSPTKKQELKPELDEIQHRTKAALKKSLKAIR
ncbi:MAG: peptide deformylase [Verrucomicrobia bacterium]|jgi:peptide deformylase|nr:peptide deformylase [Verrucomicrobiota bacterium]